MDYAELAEKAHQEIDEQDLDETMASTMHSVVDTMLELYENKNRYYHSPGFELVVSDMVDQTYNDFQALAARLKVKTATLVNILLEEVANTGELHISLDRLRPIVERRTRQTQVIQHHQELTITGSDLEEVERVIVQHINRVVLDPSVSADNLRKKLRIQHCNQVYVPDDISKLLVFSRVQFCDDYQFLDTQPLISS